MKGFTKCAAGLYYNYYEEELPLCPPSCPYCQSGNKPEETAKNQANTKEYLRKIRPLSVYIYALWILIAFIFGTLSAFNFEIPLAVISISLFLYQFGIKGFAKIFKAFQPIRIAIPVLIHLIAWMIITSEERMWAPPSQEIIRNNIMLLAPIYIYIFLYPFFAMWRQLRMVNGFFQSTIRQILNTLMLFMTDFVIGALISISMASLVLIIVFTLKPQCPNLALPTIGIVLIFALMLLQWRIKAKTLIISSVSIFVLIVCVWIIDLSPYDYNDKKEFSEGFAVVKKTTYNYEYLPFIYRYKYGFIDKTGKVVIPCEYDKAYPFSNGRAVVSNGYDFYIDKNNKRISEYDKNN